MIDTLKLSKRLQAAKFSIEQAEALAEGLNESLKEAYVSREYMDSRLARLELRMVGWVALIVGVFDGALFWGLSNLIHSLK